MRHVPKSRITVSLAVTATALVALAGCSAPAGSAEADGDVTLTYAIWDQNQQPAMEQIAEAFTEEHPNVDVEIQLTPYKEYFTKLQTAVSGGAAADVFWMNGPNFQLYAGNGVLAPSTATASTRPTTPRASSTSTPMTATSTEPRRTSTPSPSGTTRPSSTRQGSSTPVPTGRGTT